MVKNNINFKKTNLLIITLCIFLFSIFNLYEGYSLVGKTFSGFGTGQNLMFAPALTNYAKEMRNYDQILEIDRVKIRNIEQLKSIITNKKTDIPVDYTYLRSGEIKHSVIKTTEFSFSVFNEFFIIPFILSLFYLIIGTFIIFNYKNNDNKLDSLLFFLLMFALSSNRFYEQIYVHNFVVIGYILEGFTVAALMQLGLSINFKNFKAKTFKILSILNIVIATVQSFSTSILMFLIKGDVYGDSTFYQYYLISFKSYVFYVALSFLIFGFLVFYSYLKSPEGSLEKVQSRIIFTGSILAFSPYFVLWFVPFMLGYHSSLENVLICFVSLPVFITYAIIRYKAFDIEVFIRKGLLYATLSTTLILGYFGISTLAFLILKNLLNLNHEVYIVASAIMATLMTSKLSSNIQNIIDKAFYRHKLDLSILMEEFINQIINIFDKGDLLSKSIFYLEKTVNPAFVGLYLPDESKKFMQLLGSNNSLLPERLPGLSSKSGSHFNEIMNVNNALLLPLQKDNDTIGILVLGEKKSEMDYFFEEKNFLKNFTVGLSMALNNLVLKEETMSLIIKNMELENKAHFLRQLTANLSHDLKFPLSSAYSIVGKLKYVVDKKSIISKEFVQDNVNDLSKSLKKIGEYISISLDKELISLGKLVLKNEKVDMKRACEDAIFLHSDYLEKNSIKMKCNFQNEDAIVKGDNIRLESVISNLMSNAIKYGGDTINININTSGSNLLIEVSDNGPGIDNEVKARVFDCYVKSNQFSGSGKDRSTGLGLFICKTYIEMMNGNIWFESEHGKGTTFFIKLPLVDSNYKNNDEDDSYDYGFTGIAA